MAKVVITFPDGSIKEYDKGVKGIDIARSIGRRLADDALAVQVNGQMWDLDRSIDQDSTIKILTFKDKEGVEVFRHSTAHILAYAVQQLYPEAKNTIGPPVEEGFYYDFDDLDIKSEDLPIIEKKMEEIAREGLGYERKELTMEEVKKIFAKNKYKIEMASEFQTEGQKLTAYTMGKEFFDLCRGPHVPNNKMIKAIKLRSVTKAYWRGDIKNKQLTRIYGVSFPSRKELGDYLKLLEEAEKRDHRKIGREQGLFIFSELVGPGLALWTPKGTMLRTLLDDYVWELRTQYGYQKVTIPHLTKKELYETSGHWQKFSNDLFKTVSREGHMFVIKPMNCPHHTQIFAGFSRSYRDMPQRYAETTICYRDEQTGELSGLSRVRGFTQDDAHVFCRTKQIKEEFLKIWSIVEKFYSCFGFVLQIRLSLHDPKNMNAYIGNPEKWEQSEKILRDIVNEKKTEYIECIGEAAFYGPKIDFMAKDSLGRKWQVATIQLDLNMPERFDLYCINENNEKERVAMIHAAIMGSIERFLSVLIEHLAGSFPLWLNPEQIRIIPVSDKFNEQAKNVAKKFTDEEFRVHVDERSEGVSRKIRDAQLEKVNYAIVIGEKEIEGKQLTIRTRDGKLHEITQEKFMKAIRKERDKKSMNEEF